MGTGEAVGASALEAVYQIRADAVVQARVGRALVYVDLALRARVTCENEGQVLLQGYVFYPIFFRNRRKVFYYIFIHFSRVLLNLK